MFGATVPTSSTAGCCARPASPASQKRIAAPQALQAPRPDIYQGEVRLLDGGALQLSLAGFADGRDIVQRIRVAFAQDGTLRYEVAEASAD
jgi:hypothetical protein